MTGFVNGLIEGLVAFATDLLIPFMCLIFVAADGQKARVVFKRAAKACRFTSGVRRLQE